MKCRHPKKALGGRLIGFSKYAESKPDDMPNGGTICYDYCRQCGARRVRKRPAGGPETATEWAIEAAEVEA